ncbi:MAG TPA: 5-(carboxyamino)imidazole ribonucleotide synthase [Steroidobacteraceae bacterium]|nr:5-(carboxyamino)imidazole ribonucleotide synthase [Steroidobacteraceae bacterium]
MKIGIIGAGQLGRMLALAGFPLGLSFRFIDRSPDAPGGQVAPLRVGALDDVTLLGELAREVDVVTFDWENVSAAGLAAIEAQTTVLPPAAALATSQDRLAEKELFRQLRIPTPEFAAVDSERDLERAVARVGLPGVLKTRRLGYDGKGQKVLRSAADVAPAWQELGAQALIYESFVDFSREVSIIGARGRSGETRFYPLAANVHREGILSHSIAPYSNRGLQRLAERYLRAVFARFSYAGVLAIEFFVVRGRLLANEMAPRVHNSGHWTIEGAVTSQFENHLRAIVGWPLGSTAPTGHSAMLNFIGRMPERARWLKEPNLFYHDYGKEPRERRKLGHCTVLEASAAARDRRLKGLLRLRERSISVA